MLEAMHLAVDRPEQGQVHFAGPDQVERIGHRLAILDLDDAVAKRRDVGGEAGCAGI